MPLWDQLLHMLHVPRWLQLGLSLLRSLVKAVHTIQILVLRIPHLLDELLFLLKAAGAAVQQREQQQREERQEQHEQAGRQLHALGGCSSRRQQQQQQQQQALQASAPGNLCSAREAA